MVFQENLIKGTFGTDRRFKLFSKPEFRNRSANATTAMLAQEVAFTESFFRFSRKYE